MDGHTRGFGPWTEPRLQANSPSPHIRAPQAPPLHGVPRCPPQVVLVAPFLHSARSSVAQTVIAGPGDRLLPCSEDARAAAGSRAAWRDHEGNQRSKSFDRKSDTQKHLSTVEADLLRGTYVDPRSGRITLAEYAEDWMSKQQRCHSTRTLAESHMRNHIGPGLGARPLVYLIY